MLLEKVKSGNPRYYWITYEDIIDRYNREGQDEKAQEILKKIYEIRKNDFTITQQNFLEVYRIINSRAIRLVLMQYPTLNVSDVEKIFRGDEDIIYIENKENFENALKNASYEDLFVDSFRKTWGHATKRGNHLIAENVANVTLSLI